MKDCEINTKEQLKQHLKPLLAKQEFALHKELINSISDELQISILDCAAALSLLNYSQLLLTDQANKIDRANTVSKAVLPKQKLVRYRLDIGRKHLVSVDEIKTILIEVSGVDKNRIGRLDMRNYYSLVDLPDGMPADIFQLLADEEINQHKLNIKRVKYQARFYRRKK
ncbi:MAG: DbpA RNA binding domain-containing protein [Methylococcales bacterium]